MALLYDGADYSCRAGINLSVSEEVVLSRETDGETNLKRIMPELRDTPARKYLSLSFLWFRTIQTVQSV